MSKVAPEGKPPRDVLVDAAGIVIAHVQRQLDKHGVKFKDLPPDLQWMLYAKALGMEEAEAKQKWEEREKAKEDKG